MNWNALKLNDASNWMVKKLLFGLVLLCFITAAHGQSTYWWVGGTSGNYNASTSWSTTKGATTNSGNRTTPNAADVLIIDGTNLGSATSSAAVTINNLTNNETIASLIITRTSSFAATFGAASATLNIANDLVLTAGCTIADGGNTFVVGGSFIANNSSSATCHSGSGNIRLAGSSTASSLGFFTSSITGTATTAYTGSTITVGTVWTSNATYAVGQQVANGGYLYTVTAQSGNSGTTAPNFVGGSQTIGNITYRFAGIAATIGVTVSTTSPFPITGIAITSGGCGYTSTPAITLNLTGAGQTISVTGATLANAISLNASGVSQIANVEIANGKNILISGGGVLQINGLLNLNTSGNLALNGKTVQFNASGTTSGTTGSISNGGGTLSAGNGPSSTTTGGYVSFLGSGNTATQTVNFNTTTANASSINNFMVNRAGALIKIGTCNANKLSMLSGTLTINNGTFDDGGNTIFITGGTIVSNTSGANNTVYQSSGGKIQASRSGTNVPLTAVTTGGTLKIANIEILSANTSSYIVGAGTTLTGSLTFTGGGTINGTNLTVGDGTNDVALNVAAGSFTTAPSNWASNINLSYKGTSTAYTSNGNEIPSAATGKLKTVVINNTGGVTLSASMTITSGATLSLVAGTLNNGSFLTLQNGSTLIRTGGTLGAVPTYGSSATDRVNVSIAATCAQGNEVKGTTGKVGTLTINGGTYTLASAISVDSLIVTNSTDVLNCASFAVAGNTSNTIGNAGNGQVQTQSLSNPSLPLTSNGWANTVSYNATTGTQYVAGGLYSTLNLGATGATTVLNALGNISVSGTLTTVAATTVFDLGTNTFSSVGTLANAGTIRTASTASTPLPSPSLWNGTIVFNGTALQSLPAGTYPSFTIANNIGLQLQGATTLTGQLTFTNSGVLTVGANTLTLQGTLVTNGTTGNIDANDNNATVIYNGTAAQSIAANTFTNSNTVSNLTINNANSISLAGNLNVSKTLSLVSGIVTTSTNSLTVTNTATNAISGGSNSAYINGALTRVLASNNTANINYAYPVGSASSGTATLLPFTLVNPVTGAGTVSATVTAFGSGNSTTVDASLTGVSNEYWNFASSGNLTSASFSLTSASAIKRSLVASKTTGSYASIGGLASSGTVTAVAGSVASQTLAVGTPLPLAITSIVPSNPVIAGQANGTGYYGQTLTISGTGYSANTTVTVNGATATVVTQTPLQLTVVLPTAATATGNVVVTDSVTASSAFSALGYITTSAGEWSNPSIWVGGAVPPANANVFIANAVTITNTNYSATVGALTILSTGSLTFGNTNTVSATSVTNNGTINMSAGGNLTLTGTTPVFSNNGTFTYGIGTLGLNGSTSNTINGQTVLYNVSVGGNANLSGITINGTLVTTGSGTVTGNPIPGTALASYPAGQMVTIYAAPNGSATGGGTCFLLPASLDRAKAIVKAYPSNPCTVLLEDGTYNQLTLDSSDTRTATTNVVYKAINKGNAIFQPLKTINKADFQNIPDSIKDRIVDNTAKGKVKQLNLTTYNFNAASIAPWANVFADNNLITPQFYSSGTVLKLSRYPNDTVMRMNGVIVNGNNRPDTGGVFRYTDARASRWVKALNDEGVWLAGNWRVPWVLQYVKTKSFDTINKIATHNNGVSGGIGEKFHRPVGDSAEPYFVSNLFEEIDFEGEWSINFNTKMLYMWVPDTGTLQYSDVLTDAAIKASKVSYTRFQDVKILGGAGNGVQLNSCQNVGVAGVEITNTYGDALWVNTSSNCNISSNDIHDVGSAGIVLTDANFNNNQSSQIAANNTIINNHVYSYAQQAPTYHAGIDVSKTVGNRVANNKVHDSPHAGILYGGGNNNVFENNEVYDVVKVYFDLGAFYGAGTWKDRGNQFLHNYIHDLPTGNGLYLDDFTSGDTCSNNIIANVSYGMYNHDGFSNRFSNNVVVNTARPYVCTIEVDTTASYKKKFDSLKALYNRSAAFRNAYPDLQDVCSGTKADTAYTSRYWTSAKNNAFYTFNGLFKGQTFTYVTENSLFNTDGSTNSTYARNSDPFKRWGTVFEDNFKRTNQLTNPISPFNMDSLRQPGLLTAAGATNWHINRLGLFADSFRTDISTTGVAGIAPKQTLVAFSKTNHIFPDTTILTLTVTNPNIDNCISSVQFLDNGTPIPGLTITKTNVSYDTVVYTATWSGTALGAHALSSKIIDSPYWSYQSATINFTTDSAILWTGNIDTRWDLAGNWSPSRVPTATDVALIPGSAVRMPTVSGIKQTVNRVNVKAGATITIADTLAVLSDIQSEGTINGNGQLQVMSTTDFPLTAGKTWTVTVRYNATASQKVVTGNYAHLDISGGNRVLSDTGVIAVAGNYTVTTGTLVTNGSTLHFNGSTTQTISGATTFANLQVTKSGIVNALVLGGNTTVTGVLTLNSGRIHNAANYNFTLNNSNPTALIGGSATAFIDGPFSRNTTVGNTYSFPVGDYTSSAFYLPDTLTGLTANGVITITAVKANANGSFNASLFSISNAEYWMVQSSVANTLALAIAPSSLGTNNMVGQSATANGVYNSIGGILSSTSITASNISVAANQPTYLLAAYYPDPTISNVVSCIPGITANSFYAMDTLTINGTYIKGNYPITVGGKPVTIIDSSNLPNQIKVLVNATPLNGTVQINNTVFAANYLPGYVTRYNGSWNTAATWLGAATPTGSSITATINNVVTMTSSINGIQNLTINAGASYTTSNVGTTYNSGATLINNGTYSTANSNTYTNLTFVNNGRATLGGQTYTNVNLTNNAGDSIIISSSSVTMSGTITNNGYFKHTSTAMYVNGSLTLNGSKMDTINSLTLNAGTSGTITFTTAPYLSGNFAFNAPYTVTGNNPVYASTGNVYYNTGATQPIGAEWKPNVTSGAGVPATVLIGNGNAGSSISLMAGNTYKCNASLTVSNGCTLAVPSTVTLQSTGLKVVGTLNIANGGLVQSASTATINSTGVVNVGSSVLGSVATTSNGGLLITSGACNDTGTVNNYGYIRMSASNFSLFSTGTLGMNSNAVLELANNSPAVPSATWNANANLYLTGLTNGTPTNIAQSFGHVLWNCTSQTGTPNIVGFNNLAGTFTILNTGTGIVRLNNTSNTFGGLQVGGSATVNGATVNTTAASLNLAYTTASTTQVNGNITLGTAGTLAASMANTNLGLTGNWSNAGTFTTTNTTVIFNGSAAQTISRTGGETFLNLTMNGAGGATLNNPATITGALTLTNGKLSLGSNNLTLNSGITVTGASANSYIATTGTGKLIRKAVATTATLFPIGTSTSYTPLTISNNAASDMTVGVSPTVSITAFDTSRLVKLQWSVLSSITTTSTSIQYQFNSSNGASNFSPANAMENAWNSSTTNVFTPLSAAGTAPVFTLTKSGLALVGNTTYNSALGNLNTFQSGFSRISNANPDVYYTMAYHPRFK